MKFLHFFSRIVFFGAVVLSCALGAVFGGGSAYQTNISPGHIGEARGFTASWEGVYADGWLADGAKLTFPKLFSRGNTLTLQTTTARPKAAGPAKLLVSLCGKESAAHEVAPGETFRVRLPGACEPRDVEFEVQNPFIPGGSDTRALGVQVKSFRVASFLSVPLLDGETLALFFFALLALSSLFLLSWPQSTAAGLFAILLPLLAARIMAGEELLYFMKVEALWIFFFFLFAGFAVGRLFQFSAGREAPELSRTSMLLALFGIVALAVALRFYGIDFGLPSNYHPDEVPKVDRIMLMRANGDLNPRYFLHPSLLLYSTYFVNTVFHWFGMAGEFRETAFIAGRTVSALAGTGTVLLTFCLGKLLLGARAGLLGALFLAVFPLHVTCSRYMKEDALLVFWVVACAFAVVYAALRDRPRFLFLASFLAGVAASSKYSGLLAVVLVVGAPWLKSGALLPDRRFLKIAFVSLIMAPIGFLLCSPYVVLNFERFVKDFRVEKKHMKSGHTLSIDAWSQLWMYHFRRSFLPGLSTFTALCGVFAVGFVARAGRMKELFLVALILLFYLPAEWVKAKPAPQPERYILPCLPFVAVAMGIVLSRLLRSRFAALAVLLFAGALFFPTSRTLELASEIRYDTRQQMEDWMRQNLETGAKVSMDRHRYSPEFRNGEFQIEYLPRSNVMQALDLSDLRRSENDYLVLSSLSYERYFTQPTSSPLHRERLRQVFSRLPIVHEINPQFGTYGFHNPSLTLFSLRADDIEKFQEEVRARKSGALGATTNERISQFRFGYSY